MSRPTPLAEKARAGVPFPIDWLLLGVLAAGLAVMLVTLGTGQPEDTETDGARMAVGMTPTDQAIMLQLVPCADERVESITLRAVESDLVLWEATAINRDERFVFVVGQPPRTFVETVPMIEVLPRGALLEATIVADTVHSVQFFYADLLPDLWSYGGTYYPNEELPQAVVAEGPCGLVTIAGGARRIIIVVAFLVAAGAGAGLVARRLVAPGL